MPIDPDPGPPPRRTDTVLGILDLEELDTDLYRGFNETTLAGRVNLFGGQVAAQALRAAALTVPEGRLPHSLHGYFLRPGRAERTVILRVDRDRDGRSFSARHVAAMQDGQVIFDMLASFQIPAEGVEYTADRPAGDLGPDDLAEQEGPTRFHPILRIRPFPPDQPFEEDELALPRRLWVRTAEALPDDPIIHACVLTYVSDIGSGFADGTVAGAGRFGPSIDHAVWFQHPLRMDDWALLHMWPLKAGGLRGLYAGSITDRTGRMGAMLTQEMLFRERRK
jgi:acyl-CoA thioesterase II